MKRFLVVILLCGISRAAITCAAPVNFANAGGLGNSSAVNTTGASLFVSFCTGLINSCVMHDSQNNTWQYAGAFLNVSNRPNAIIAWVVNPSTSATHTFGFQPQTANFQSESIYVCSGTSTDSHPLIAFQASGPGGPTFTMPTVTPAEAGDLVLTGAASQSSGTFTASINQSFVTPNVFTPSSGEIQATSYLVAPSTSPVNPTWTMSANTNWVSGIAIFKASTGATTPNTPPFISLVAGTPQSPSANAYDGNGTCTQMYWPAQIAIDAIGNLLFPDLNNNRICAYNTTSSTQTILGVTVPSHKSLQVCGNGNVQSFADGACSVAEFGHPVGMRNGPGGCFLVADQQNYRIREICGSTVTTIAGSGPTAPNTCNTSVDAGDGGPALSATIACPQGVAYDPAINVVYIGTSNYRVRAVNLNATSQVALGTTICAGCIQTVVGTGTGQCNFTSNPTTAWLYYPLGMAVDPSSNLYFALFNCHVIIKVTAAGVLSVFAGTGTAGFSGDGGSPTSAQINTPFDVNVDTHGRVCIADTGNGAIRLVNNGIITTVAGDPSLYGIYGGYSGDGGPATLAALGGDQINVGPLGCTFDMANNLWIADAGNNLVRMTTVGNLCKGVCAISGIKMSNGISIH